MHLFEAAPANLARSYNNLEGNGGVKLTTPISDTLVKALNPVVGTNDDGCAPLTNAAEVAGHIVLIRRGVCTFIDKAHTAQAAGAIALWFVFVPGSALTEVTVPAAVKVTNLPDDLELESVEPSEVQVTLRGIRRELVLSDPNQVAVRVDGYLARMGRRTFAIEEDSVRRPEALDVVGVHPDRVKVSLRPAAGAAPGG